MTAIASHYVDTSPREEPPSGVHAKPVARPSLLAAHLSGPAAPAVRIYAVVAKRFGVSYEEIDSKDRHPRIANARHVTAWLLRQQQLSYPEIGRIIGRRDHTTAMHSVKRIDCERATDPRVAASLDELLLEAFPVAEEARTE